MSDDLCATSRMVTAKQCLYNAALQQLHATLLTGGNVNDAVEAVQQSHLEYILASVHHNKTVMEQS